MTPKEKAEELVNKFCIYAKGHFVEWDNIPGRKMENAKQCALIAVENEYHSLRELLFNLRATHVIESESVYLYRVGELLNEESEIKTEIEKL